MIFLFFLGFSSGLPLALSGSTLQAWFASENNNLLAIGLLSLTGQPYIYKFLWAPFVDLGKRFYWIVTLQCCLVGVLILMAFFQPKTQGIYLGILALMLAFFSATQDIAIDACRTETLNQYPKERGLGGAFFVTAYRVSMMFSSGIALIFADHYGWHNTYFLMAFSLFCMIPINVHYLRIHAQKSMPLMAEFNFKQTIIQPFQEFLSRPLAKFLLAFLILYKAGDAFTVSLSTVFLIKVLHYSLSVVGSVNKIVGISAAILGSFAGGFLLTRLCLYRALLYFGIGQALCSFLFMLLAIIGKNFFLLLFTVFTDNLFSGMSAIALLALMTSLCHQKFNATQFALFSAIASISRVFMGPLAGLTVNAIGWTYFFLSAFFASLPGLCLLWFFRKSYTVWLSTHIRSQ